MDGEWSREIEATVDTGAAYTTLPASLLRGIGVEPRGKRRFLLADGRRIEMDWGEARASVNGEDVMTLVVFGEDEAPALLGAYTLEGLALAVDPVEQRLVPPTSFCIEPATSSIAGGYGMDAALFGVGSDPHH